MVQHLLEFLDETAHGLQWAVPQWGSGGKAHVSAGQRGAFAICRGDRGGRVGKQMGKKGI